MIKPSLENKIITYFGIGYLGDPHPLPQAILKGTRRIQGYTQYWDVDPLPIAILRSNYVVLVLSSLFKYSEKSLSILMGSKIYWFFLI